MEVKYTIKVKPQSFFRNYLTLNRPIIDSYLTKLHKKNTHLTDKPLGLLERLLFYNFVIAHKNPKLTREERWRLLTSVKGKRKIAEDLGLMDEKRVNTYLSRLRKLKIVSDSGINSQFEIYPKDMSITYKIILDAGTR